jgi:FAD/FMN-containing dehydrogenase
MSTDDNPTARFVGPGEPEFDSATRVFNLTAPARPDLAVTVRSVPEVRAAIGRAVADGLPVRVHTTGHACAQVRRVRGGLLVRTALDGAVEIDVRRRTARVPAGTTWGAVVPRNTGWRRRTVPPNSSAWSAICFAAA